MTFDKLNKITQDLTNQNIARLAELFPECVTEGPEGTASDRGAAVIDFDLLRQALSDDLVEGPQERYRLDWPGKRHALLTANAPIDKTLRPMRDESVDYDTTRNLFIEGDNLDGLKLLQETYLGKVKLIYIDPPYNTGKDFIYKDNFAQTREEYESGSGQRDQEGGRLVANPETNGRFHSDWLSMMYPRLKLARNLLSDDGCCAISINEKEKYNLRMCLVQIFGEANVLAEITIVTGANQSGEGVLVQKNTESLLIVTKDVDQFYVNRIDSVKGAFRNLNDAPTPFSTRPDMGYTIYYNPQTEDLKPVFDYDKSKIATNDPNQVYRDDAELISAGYTPIRPGIRNKRLHRWRWGMETFLDRLAEVVVRESEEGYQVGFTQSGLNPPKNVWSFGGGAADLSALFDDEKVFDYPKGVGFMSEILRLFGTKRSGAPAIVMDMFAGTGTLAEAAANLAAGGMPFNVVSVQYPEEIEDADIVAVTRTKDLAALARERIRRAGTKLLKEQPELKGKLDVGFRAFRIDTGNFADTRVTPQQASQEALAGMISHIKDARTDEDLLFGALLRWGVDITLPVEKRELAGRTVWVVDPPVEGEEGAALIACFARPHLGQGGIDTELADAIAHMKPLRVLFRDDGFASDAVMENVQSRFKQLARDADVKVL
jgi:adenine-specific DNA-methyltransferase